MSYVTGVLIQFSVCEHDERVKEINNFIGSKDCYFELTELQEDTSGKHPQIHILASGWNHTSIQEIQEFSEFLISLKWEYPGQFCALFTTEDNDTMITRTRR